MVRLVIDPNVFVSGLIGHGPPAEVIDLARYGELRAVVCPRLLDELEGVLGRPRFRRYVELEEVKACLQVIHAIAIAEPDPTDLSDITAAIPMMPTWWVWPAKPARTRSSPATETSPSSVIRACEC